MRLAKQAVDQERQALLAISNEIADIDAEIEASRQTMQREGSASLDFMTSGATLSAYLDAGKARIRGLMDRRQVLEQAYDIQLERVRLQRVEEKRYERLAERRAQQAAREEVIKEQKAIDELVITGRKPS